MASHPGFPSAGGNLVLQEEIAAIHRRIPDEAVVMVAPTGHRAVSPPHELGGTSSFMASPWSPQ